MQHSQLSPQLDLKQVAGECRWAVSVPYEASDAATMEDKMSEGFALKWRDYTNCQRCQKSDGRCVLVTRPPSIFSLLALTRTCPIPVMCAKQMKAASWASSGKDSGGAPHHRRTREISRLISLSGKENCVIFRFTKVV